MKKYLISISFITVLTSVIGQNWETGGNVPCPGPQCVDGTNNIIGPQDNVAIRVFTSGLERYRITPFGSFQWFGSNATAFRSMALGDNTTASGENAFSGGLNSQATFSNSFSFGVNNQSNNVGAVTFGNSNVASGSNAMAIGSGNHCPT